MRTLGAPTSSPPFAPLYPILVASGSRRLCQRDGRAARRPPPDAIPPAPFVFWYLPLAAASLPQCVGGGGRAGLCFPSSADTCCILALSSLPPCLGRLGSSPPPLASWTLLIHPACHCPCSVRCVREQQQERAAVECRSTGRRQRRQRRPARGVCRRAFTVVARSRHSLPPELALRHSPGARGARISPLDDPASRSRLLCGCPRLNKQQRNPHRAHRNWHRSSRSGPSIPAPPPPPELRE